MTHRCSHLPPRRAGEWTGWRTESYSHSIPCLHQRNPAAPHWSLPLPPSHPACADRKDRTPDKTMHRYSSLWTTYIWLLVMDLFVFMLKQEVVFYWLKEGRVFTVRVKLNFRSISCCDSLRFWWVTVPHCQIVPHDQWSGNQTIRWISGGSEML